MKTMMEEGMDGTLGLSLEEVLEESSCFILMFVVVSFFFKGGNDLINFQNMFYR